MLRAILKRADAKGAVDARPLRIPVSHLMLGHSSAGFIASVVTALLGFHQHITARLCRTSALCEGTPTLQNPFFSLAAQM